ncbi:MAG: pyridoxamine 5'-phosphate oxidase family protein [Burkholderiaceae bacterium]
MMKTARKFSSDIAFTPTVKQLQDRKGSRHAYARMEQGGSWETRITPELKAFIESQTSVFLATANSEGQPTIQHRGGPAGFLHVLDEQTIGFVDFTGNRQYISAGNLADNPKAHLFLMDYANRQRVKMWGEAKAVEGDGTLVDRLFPQDYPACAEHVIIFKVAAWDANCPKHIPQRFEAGYVAAALAERDQRIAELEAEIKQLRTGVAATNHPPI